MRDEPSKRKGRTISMPGLPGKQLINCLCSLTALLTNKEVVKAPVTKVCAIIDIPKIMDKRQIMLFRALFGHMTKQWSRFTKVFAIAKQSQDIVANLI